MGINLTQFFEVKFKPSNKITRCRNCHLNEWQGEPPWPNTPIMPGNPRIVVESGYGPLTRHLTLCPDCASHQLDILSKLVADLTSAIEKCESSLKP